MLQAKVGAKPLRAFSPQLAGPCLLYLHGVKARMTNVIRALFEEWIEPRRDRF